MELTDDHDNLLGVSLLQLIHVTSDLCSRYSYNHVIPQTESQTFLLVCGA